MISLVAVSIDTTPIASILLYRLMLDLHGLIPYPDPGLLVEVGSILANSKLSVFCSRRTFAEWMVIVPVRLLKEEPEYRCPAGL